MITEDQLCLTWFQAIGYDYVCGYDIVPDGDSPEQRSDYRQIVLFDRLLAQLQKINPHTPLSVLESVSQQIAKSMVRDTLLPKLLSGESQVGAIYAGVVQ